MIFSMAAADAGLRTCGLGPKFPPNFFTLYTQVQQYAYITPSCGLKDFRGKVPDLKTSPQKYYLGALFLDCIVINLQGTLEGIPSLLD